jgi:hypothetical protein
MMYRSHYLRRSRTRGEEAHRSFSRMCLVKNVGSGPKDEEETCRGGEELAVTFIPVEEDDRIGTPHAETSASEDPC